MSRQLPSHAPTLPEDSAHLPPWQSPKPSPDLPLRLKVGRPLSRAWISLLSAASPNELLFVLADPPYVRDTPLSRDTAVTHANYKAILSHATGIDVSVLRAMKAQGNDPLFWDRVSFFFYDAAPLGPDAPNASALAAFQDLLASDLDDALSTWQGRECFFLSCARGWLKGDEPALVASVERILVSLDISAMTLTLALPSLPAALFARIYGKIDALEGTLGSTNPALVAARFLDRLRSGQYDPALMRVLSSRDDWYARMLLFQAAVAPSLNTRLPVVRDIISALAPARPHEYRPLLSFWLSSLPPSGLEAILGAPPFVASLKARRFAAAWSVPPHVLLHMLETLPASALGSASLSVFVSLMSNPDSRIRSAAMNARVRLSQAADTSPSPGKA